VSDEIRIIDIGPQFGARLQARYTAEVAVRGIGARYTIDRLHA
jgi:hypothetical protein